MRTKLMYALSALMMVMTMLVTSCKENEEIQPEPEPEFTFAEDAVILIDELYGYVDSYTLKTINSELELYIGSKDNGQAYSYPLTEWSSSNTDVLSISSTKGTEIIATSLKEGTSTITATDEKGNKLTLIVTVAIAKFSFADDAAILIDGIQGSQESYNLAPSATANLSIGKYWNMERYDYPSTQWNSSDPSVASVSNAVGSKTTVTAIKTGTAIITAEDSNSNELTLVINVISDKINFELPSGDNFNMIYVEGGTFSMGATSEQEEYAFDSEFPAHSVTLSDFYLAEFEVTQELWTAVMGTTIYQQRDKEDSSWSLYGTDASNPMYYINHSECEEFTGKLNNLLRDKLPQGFRFSLPSEAQWEYAARGGKKAKKTIYAGSDYLSEVGWYGENASNLTRTVGAKLQNELGIYDMSGNVYEWCIDWASDSYYSNSPENNPVNLSTSSGYIIRGGCWSINAVFCRVAYRSSSAPSARNYSIGMRIALVQ